jgi:osmoprotectant transport system permease protein
MSAIPGPGPLGASAPSARRGRAGLARRCLLLLLAILTAPVAEAEGLVIGSKRFTESYILGEILTQAARGAGEAKVTHTQGLGNTAILFAAVQAGRIDLYADYTGTLGRELLKTEATDLPALNRGLEPLGLGAAVPLGFNNTYALAVREDRAGALGLTRIGDLAAHSGLRLGLSHELLKRSDGWPGLKAAYGLPQEPRGLDHGIAYDALAAGQIDVMDVYTTDAKIARYGLRVLADDRGYFPEYAAVIVYRLDLPSRFPRAWAALGRLQGTIDAGRMIAMNAAAELEGQPFEAVAAAFLNQGGLGTASAPKGLLAALLSPDLWRLTWEHLMLVLVSLAAAVMAGVPLGIWAHRSRAAARPILATVGLIQTVPSLALLAFLIPLLGTIGALPALFALFLYALLPIVRNTHSGLTEIPPHLRESARALGLPELARLRLVELPMASRSILAGIQTSAVINVGTATIAAFIGAGGYGERIVTGLALNDNTLLLAGAIPAATLALLVQGVFELIDRRLVPAGLRVQPPR